MHSYACIDTLAVTVGEFVTDYISENGRQNQIIGELPMNGSVQLIGLSEIWGSGFPFIPNPRAPDCFSGQVSTIVASSNGNNGYNTVTGRWVGS